MPLSVVMGRLAALKTAGLNASATVATAEAWCLWMGRSLSNQRSAAG